MSDYCRTFVTHKWTPVKGYRSSYSAQTVNALAAGLQRHYPRPHTLVCFTDDPVGIDSAVKVLPVPTDFSHVPSPHGGTNPSCYRRLRLFSTEIKPIVGDRFMALDLDIVITADIRPLVDRTEDIVLWGDTNPNTHYNGSLLLMTTGARRHVWEVFDPEKSPRLARSAGHHGSDQAWISYVLGPKEAKWTTRDGVYSFRNHLDANGGKLPEDARLVVFHGAHDPWGVRAQKLGWVRDSWGVTQAEVAA